MKILVVFASYSSGTMKVAELAEGFLREAGHDVSVKRADAVQGTDLTGPDLVIMASPSWKVMGKEGMPHEFYFAMMERLSGQTFDTKFAVIGLGDDSYAQVCGSADHLMEFVKQLGGTLVGQPLRLEGFYFNEPKRTAELKEWLPTVTV
jgi:flavodoxin I